MDKLLQVIVFAIVAYIAIQFLPLPGPVDPKPSPKPGPVDPVDPRPEPTFAGYDTKIYAEIIKVKSRTRKADCEQLSADVKTIIDRIDSGEITANQVVADELANAIRKLPPAWYGQVRKILNKVLQPLTDDKTLNSPARWSKFLKVAKVGIDRAGAESTGVAEKIDGG